MSYRYSVLERRYVAEVKIAPDGVLKKLSYYKQKGSDRPMMIQSMKGIIEIAG